MWKSYLVSWKKCFNFKDRSTRKEYWIVFFITILFPFIFLFLNIIQSLLISLFYYNFYISVIAVNLIRILSLILLLIFCGQIWTLLPLTVRRIRDVGMKWQWIFLVPIPIIGFIFILIFLTRKSFIESKVKKIFSGYIYFKEIKHRRELREG